MAASEFLSGDRWVEATVTVAPPYGALSYGKLLQLFDVAEPALGAAGGGISNVSLSAVEKTGRAGNGICEVGELDDTTSGAARYARAWTVAAVFRLPAQFQRDIGRIERLHSHTDTGVQPGQTTGAGRKQRDAASPSPLQVAKATAAWRCCRYPPPLTAAPVMGGGCRSVPPAPASASRDTPTTAAASAPTATTAWRACASARQRVLPRRPGWTPGTTKRCRARSLIAASSCSQPFSCSLCCSCSCSNPQCAKGVCRVSASGLRLGHESVSAHYIVVLSLSCAPAFEYRASGLKSPHNTKPASLHRRGPWQHSTSPPGACSACCAWPPPPWRCCCCCAAGRGWRTSCRGATTPSTAATATSALWAPYYTSCTSYNLLLQFCMSMYGDVLLVGASSFLCGDAHVPRISPFTLARAWPSVRQESVTVPCLLQLA